MDLDEAPRDARAEDVAPLPAFDSDVQSDTPDLDVFIAPLFRGSGARDAARRRARRSLAWHRTTTTGRWDREEGLSMRRRDASERVSRVNNR